MSRVHEDGVESEAPSVALETLTLMEFDTPRRERSGSFAIHDVSVTMNEIGPNQQEVSLPKATLVIVAETELLKEGEGIKASDAAPSEVGPMLAALSDRDFEFTKTRVRDWDGTRFYSDFIADGLKDCGKDELKDAKVVMLFESPSSFSTPDNSTFHNKENFRFHDWPPPKSALAKGYLGPCRYALMNGDSLPVFLRSGKAPDGLIDHWRKNVPGFKEPSFVKVIKEEETAYAYLPVESIKHHVNDPQIHYHLAGKDSIVVMTQKTTRLLPDTRTYRPCVVKTTHSMGSKGIFIIRDDKDEKEFEEFLAHSGHPTFVITDFVDIHRNVACHFFMHPNGEITWFGSNENKRLPDGRFSSDSYLVIEDQQKLKMMQLPFVEEVVQYCASLGFWGFCGCDVLFDSLGKGYLVDINPRVTGSCPALMTLHRFHKEFGFTCGLFRRTGDINSYMSSKDLLAKVEKYNDEHAGNSRVILHSFFEPIPGEPHTRANIGVYGFDIDQLKDVLNSFVGPSVEVVPPKA